MHSCITFQPRYPARIPRACRGKVCCLRTAATTAHSAAANMRSEIKPGTNASPTGFRITLLADKLDGKRQLNLIRLNLADAKQGAHLSLTYLEYSTIRLFPARSMLIVLSSLGIHDMETYAQLRGLGYEILVISPDPVDYVHRILPPTQINDWAVRAARRERRVQLKQLMKLGVKVIDWQIN